MAEPGLEGDTPPKSNDSVALLARVDKLEASNSRLVDESKANKKRAQDAEAKIAEHENAKLEADGKYKERLDIEIAERQKISEDLESTRSKVLSGYLKTEAMKHAPDAHDIDMVLKVTKHKALLSLDETALTVGGVEEYIKAVREDSPYLFKQAGLPTTETTRPKTPNGPGDPPGPNAEYLAELKKTKTQAEYDAVVTKFGRD